MNVYFISGLAADSRVFKYIRLPEYCKPVYLDWIEPLKNESLNDYALRLAAGIDTNTPFAIAGLSMGGMIAVEIAKKLTPVAVILISSVPSPAHLPLSFKIAGILRLHQIVPISLLKSAAIMKHFFTIETNADKVILQQVIQERQ